ncbi:Uncharacterised protein [Vibrio cholerae]|uniref:Uncharacterized protein n=1 Tax=Vibrio cholerae TaxID=666 RepID=A0A655VJT0_VIBCL|nr:Uncharacterised protein [Vibrio cholerae]CSA49910.1 Uncharacterised protein [Vibrio cholerae]CSB69636.1 Uncharacterised protein [Vibrio cholerae]CSB74178.1 Uncharacterised protein [Vibrio cholerae]CSB88469.1 Uncharacterised protein [Vibrio cholerae]
MLSEDIVKVIFIELTSRFNTGNQSLMIGAFRFVIQRFAAHLLN